MRGREYVRVCVCVLQSKEESVLFSETVVGDCRGRGELW